MPLLVWFLLTAFCCCLIKLHHGYSLEQCGTITYRSCLSTTSEGLFNLHLIVTHPLPVSLSLPQVFSNTVTLVLFLQMWTNVRPAPTAVGPASSVWTLWVHLYASCRSLVLQATSWGTAFARVSSLFLMYFIKVIYPAVISRTNYVANGNADDVFFHMQKEDILLALCC